MDLLSSINFLEKGFLTASIILFAISFLSKYTVGIIPSSVLQFIRYGKLNLGNVKTNSAITAMEVPKSWFAHFYTFAVITQSIMLHTVLRVYFSQDLRNHAWVYSILNLMGGNRRQYRADAFITAFVGSIFLLHLVRRLYESAFVSVYSNSKMNFFVYLLSLFYYFSAILSIIAHSPGFCSEAKGDLVLSLKRWTVLQTIGFSIFLYGFVQQYFAHVGLANLRKGKGKESQPNKHHIPRGGLFELVSSPNYWAEILIYIGIAIIFGFRNPSWNAITIWVITSQSLAGIANHKWYQSNFPDYPKERKAVIPYIL